MFIDFPSEIVNDTLVWVQLCTMIFACLYLIGLCLVPEQQLYSIIKKNIFLRVHWGSFRRSYSLPCLFSVGRLISVSKRSLSKQKIY